MNTALECMPCFRKMAVNDARLACPDDPALQRAVVAAWEKRLGEIDMTQPPPAVARHLIDLVTAMTGCTDIYRKDKRASNARVQELLPGIRAMVASRRSDPGTDPLALVLELAVVGNYIDRGIELHVDWEAELADVSASFPPEVLDDFLDRARSGADVLILGDNAGEIVLDTILVEELQRRGCDVTYAVRSKPVINDALMADAEDVGMTRLCRVVESGVDTPGTVLNRCTPQFLDRMRAADLILAKGQGNFEALQGNWPGIFCAFKAKCPRVAAETGRPRNASVLLRTTASAAGTFLGGGAA